MPSLYKSLILRIEHQTLDEDEQDQRRRVKWILPWIALLLVLVTACDGGREDATSPPPGGRPQLVLTPGLVNEVTVQLPAQAHQSWVHGSYMMCLDKPGEVRITSVEFESGDAEITAWAVRPNPTAEGKNLAGDVAGTLAAEGIENTAGVLTWVCEGQRKLYELALQLRAGESTTEGDGVVVRYTSDGQEGSLSMPDRVVLCVRPDRPDCA